MKILYASEQFGPHDQRFLAAITEFGHRAVFWHPQVVRLKSSLPAVEPAKGSLAAALREHRPDLVHAGPLHTVACRAAGAKFHPLAAMSWGSDILHTAKRNWWARRRVRKALEAADVLIADCEAVVAAAAEFGFPRQRIVKFPWGVDLARFNPSGGDGGLRQQLGWQDAFVVLHLRSWEPLYGAETVLRVFLTLAPAYPHLRLLMPGGGGLEARFKGLVAHSGFAERVHFPGILSQAELPAYYRAADLYVSASHSDGSSVSLMEALASGLPAVVSDIPSNREWVRPGEEGWLFPVGNQAALAERIVAAMGEDLADKAQHARSTAKQHADWARNKLGLQAAYELAVRAR